MFLVLLFVDHGDDAFGGAEHLETLRPLLIVLPLDEWPLRMAGQDGPDRAEAGSKVNLCERQDLH